jgi:hypothetical protein
MMALVRQTITTTKEVPSMKIIGFADLAAAPACVEPVGRCLSGNATA